MWVWDAAAPGFGSNALGPLDDFFPGLLYVDAVAMNAQGGGGRFRTDAFLARLAIGKPLGIGLTGTIPGSEYFTQQPDWAWFLAGSAAASGQATALQSLYRDGRIVSLRGISESSSR